MHGVNQTVLFRVSEWLGQGDPVWYTTVLSTWGASPRPSGSLFAINARTGKCAGSLSSGCIEQELISLLDESGPADTPRRLSYGETAEERGRLMLPCGGSIELLLEYLQPDPITIGHFENLNLALAERSNTARRVNLGNGSFEIVSAEKGANLVSVKQEVLLHQLGSRRRLLILGWGDIAEYLIPIVQSLDFEVTISEPRKDILHRASLPNEVEICSDRLPDDLIRDNFNDPYCAIIALSHDPRVDDLGLIAALDTKAFYIGALGSVRTSNKRIERLESLGLPSEKLERLHAPVGLSIQSKTPPEIAVSIAAQLVEQTAFNRC